MGVVLTVKEARQGQVHTPKAMTEVRALVRKQLRKSKAIVAALEIGSTVRGDGDGRSDMDVVVICREDSIAKAWKLTSHLCSEAKKRFVRLEFDMYDDSVIASRFHFAGPAYQRHLRASLERGGGLKGDDFIRRFAPSITVAEEIEAYFRDKIHSLQKSGNRFGSMDEEQQVLFLGKVLEAPMHAARKFLVYRDLLEDDSKQAVTARFLASAGGRLPKAFLRFVRLDRRYTAELARHLEDFDEDAYRRLLDDIYHEAPRVVRFVRDVAGVLGVGVPPALS